MKRRLSILPIATLVAIMCMGASSCDAPAQTSDSIQRQQQERLLAEGTSQIGMPSIVNFREKKLLKTIFELRDQANFTTVTYTYSEMTGKFAFFCESIGYPIPYATQFTNPQKVERAQVNVGYAIIPQADPNGLFSPAAADGTWVVCKDPTSGSTKMAATYVEPKVAAFPWRLPDSMLAK